MGVTNPRQDGATLAACQEGAIAPTRAGIAIRIVTEVSRVAGFVDRHGHIAPDNIFIRYDGQVEVTGTEISISYMAPEEAKGGLVDRRADVFSLGVVLWELLTATRLFGRDTPAATQRALLDEPMLDVRDVNPDVPAIVADVIGAALQREPTARFDTMHAFCKALENAQIAANLVPAGPADLGKWVAERVPPRVSLASSSRMPVADAVPDLDVPGAGVAARSSRRIPAAQPAGGADPGFGSIPAFDVSAMAAAALAPAPSMRPTKPVPAVSAPPPSASTKAIAFDAGDDDFDMEIERNTGGMASIPTNTSSRPSMSGVGMSGPPSSSRRPAGTGLELGAPSRMRRERDAADRDAPHEPGTGIKLVGYLLATLITGGAAFALWKYMHHAVNIQPAKVLPHAFDGSSAPESGAVSLVALVAALTVGYLGLRMKPHAWAIVVSGGALLLLALAMVTATLASTGENPTPPDGVLLVPYLLPAAIVLLALGIAGRAGRMFARGGVAARIGFIPLAMLAGALAFVAAQVSRFASY